MILPDEVVLTDDAGTDLGSVPRSLVHTESTPLHRAFSVYLLDAEGRTLITRRALSKRAWPGVWSNSCCGHPRPGESTVDAIRRRVGEELGVRVSDLTCLLPDFRYRAVDPSGVVENEICPVYAGFLDSEPAPDPEEVMDFAWVPWSQTHGALTAAPSVFSPWMVLQVPLLGEDLAGRATPAQQSGHTAAPSWEQTKGQVESVLAEQASWMSRRWLATGLAAADDPVLDHDLPTWLTALVAHVGKRIRPQMCHWGYVAAGGAGSSAAHDQVCRVAAATELLHTFALVHDDVMDESPWRRGRPAAQVQARVQHERGGFAGDPARFGDNIAILLGDLAHMQADQLIAGLPEPLRHQWFELCAELIAGQGADLTAAAGDLRSYEQAERIAWLKSGAYTIERPLLLGACAAEADEAQRRSLTDYGHALGRAFALRDDILGVWGDPDVTGKPGGDDLLARKPTVLWMAASERLDVQGQRLLDRVGTPEADADDVSRLQEAMLAAGIATWAEGRVRSLVERAVDGLDAGGLTPSGVQGLRRAAESVAWRNA
ncbi:MAG: isopentenyl-diphosphate Delta-isomerase [Ornithinimicrobium sp.]